MPRTLQLLVLHTVTVLTIAEQWCFLHFKLLRFTNTVLHLFRASVKTPSPGGELEGRTKNMSMPSKLQNVFCKFAKSFYVLCIKHLMVDDLMVSMETYIIWRIALYQVNALGQSLAVLEPVRLASISKPFIVDSTFCPHSLQQCLGSHSLC